MSETEKQKTTKWIKIRNDPVWVWFGSYYLYTLIALWIMMFFKEGSFIKAFTNQRYWIILFLKFGLNSDSNVDPWIAHNPWAFFIAPLFFMFLAMIHYLFPLAGYAINGKLISDPLGKYYSSYFDRSVFGAEFFIGPADKFNGFYVTGLFLPMFFAIITTAIYSYKRGRMPDIFILMIINYIISWFLAYYVAVMSAPVHFSLYGLLQSLILDRNLKFNDPGINKFVLYQGYYHPGSLSSVIWLFSLLPTLILAIILNLISKKYTFAPINNLLTSFKEFFTRKESALPEEFRKALDELNQLEQTSLEEI